MKWACIDRRQGFICTLDENHGGPHVAEGPNSEPMALWTDDKFYLAMEYTK